jgi:hypothetical protein
MTVKQILNEVRRQLNMPTSVPKCFSDENFMYCWCGKCVPKDYKLPDNLSKILAINAVEDYRKPESLTPTL